MESYYSILRFVNNSISNEAIAIGLVFLSDDQVFAKISQSKVDIAKKLNPKASTLLDFTLKQLRTFLDQEAKAQPGSIFKFPKRLNSEFLKRLSDYNNGLLQFSPPSYIKENITQRSFSMYFDKFIGSTDELHSLKIEKSVFQSVIEQKFCIPLKDRIDVNYTIKKKSLPSLFFDFKIDGIGVNGSIYAAKSIDFNANRQLNLIKSDISEFESVIERLKLFAIDKGIANNDPQYYLIVDPYNGKSPSYLDLYSLLKEENMPFFSLKASNELENLVDLVIKNNVRKFSDELKVAV
ncbi:MAG: hypothetical protein WCJ95_20365 [Mariniphaga sp.]